MRYSQQTKRSVSLGVRFKFVFLLSLMLLSLLLVINGETYAAATYATNAGGPAYVATDATNYQADTFYSGGLVYGTGAPITGTTDPILYETLRWGNNFSYNIPVPNGTYTVTLKFAEIFWNQPGKRSFNVFVQGVEAITGLDVFASAGGQNKAYDVPIPNVSVTGGNLNINFQTVTDNAIVSAIEVVPQYRPLADASGSVRLDGTIDAGSGYYNIKLLQTGLYEIDPLCPDGTLNCFPNGSVPVVCTCSASQPYANAVTLCTIQRVSGGHVGVLNVYLKTLLPDVGGLKLVSIDDSFVFTCGQ